MGAVHGVSAKYLLLSTVSAAGAAYARRDDRGRIVAVAFAYSALVNVLFYLLFRARMGTRILGKSSTTGIVPLWSFLVWWPFHAPTRAYSWMHARFSQARGIPVASEIAERIWIGGAYGHELMRPWAAVVDLTAEFSEPSGCAAYLNLPCWDGQPPSPAEIERGAAFAAKAAKRGDVHVHCAHGRGRSTTLAVAALVRTGRFKNWEDAFEAAREKRPCVRLNRMMREALSAWQHEFVDKRA